LGILKERDHVEDPDLDEEIMLRRIFRKCDLRGGNGLDCSDLGQGHVAGTCQCGIDISSSIK